MPLYDFTCGSCERTFEELQPINEDEGQVVCPGCGSGGVKRELSFQGGLVTEHPVWLNDHVRAVLQKEGEKPIETRTEHDRYLKKNGYIQRC